MRTTRLIVLLGLVLGLSISLTTIRAQQGGGAVAIDTDDIGGVVTGARGPEAGVWVIAETRDLPTRLIKIVVTNDQGGICCPTCRKATYDVWVRGYGLVDSPKVKAAPGKALNLTAVTAPNPAAAAQYYPAQVLVVDDAAAAEERLPRHRPNRQRHRTEPSRVRVSGSATSSRPMRARRAIRSAARRLAKSRRRSARSRIPRRRGIDAFSPARRAAR